MEWFGKTHTDYRGNLIEHPEPTDHDKELAKKAIQWARNLTDLKNDYLYNINLLAQESSITHKELGFVASIVSSFTRQMEREIIKEQRETAQKQELISDYVGTIGQKIQVELTFVNQYSFETQWGDSHIYKFMDQNGNIFIWKSSKWLEKAVSIYSELDEMEYKHFEPIRQAEVVKIRGTIKDHSEYAGAKQTILTRCKIA